jgi:hypothetical protein
MINPVGDWKDQKDRLRKMMEGWSETCQVAGLSRQDALVELKMRVLPKVMYGLESTSFSKPDCRYIMAPMLKVGLQACGVASRVPRSIVFGPSSLLGLDLADMYVVQGIRHLNLLEYYGPMSHGTNLTGKLIRSLVEEAVVMVGLGCSVFSINFEEFGALLKPGWVKTLWRFCWEYDIKVEDWVPQQKLLRKNDEFIMSAVRKQINPKDSSSLVSVNRCRRYLRVVTLSEITQGNGKMVRREALDGRRNPLCERLGCNFVDSYPTSADWRV